MNCYPEIVMRRFASGELDEPGMSEVLRHAENCPRCRHALHAAERNVEKQLLVLADRKDWFPPRPRSLKARVFTAVADDQDRRARQAGARKRHWRLAPALAAAAVLFLILGARYLGEPRWNGCLEATRGTLLLSPSGESFSAIDRVESLPPGGLIMVPAGCAGELVFGDDCRIELADSALAVVGDRSGGPRLSVARGIVRVYQTPPTGLLLQLGGRKLQVRGTCEFEVRCTSTARALTAARAWSDQTRSGVLAAILPTALAAGESPNDNFFVQVRTVTGSVSLPGEKVLATAGQELRSLDHDRWSAAVLTTAPQILDSQYLSAAELQTVPALLRRDNDAVTSLESVASDRNMSPWKRGLATWLLGDFGDPRAITPLTRLLHGGEHTPVIVRSAAVCSLSALGAIDPVLTALFDAEPAVAETAIFSLPDGSGERLKQVADSAERPDWQRVIAARRADEMGVRADVSTLLVLLDSPDPDVSALAHRLVDQLRNEDGDRILLNLARNGSPLERARALKSLRSRNRDEAIPFALEGARQTGVPLLRDQAIRFLAQQDPGRLEEFIGDALASGDEDIQTAILWSLCRNGHLGYALVEGHEEALRKIARNPWFRAMNRAMALRLLNDPDLARRVLGANPDPELLLGLLQQVDGRVPPLVPVSLIRQSTDHEQERVRLLAIQVLSFLEPVRAAQLIEERLRDSQDDRGTLLAHLSGIDLNDLGERGEALEKILIGLLQTHSDEEVRVSAAGILGRRVLIEGSRSGAALLAVAEDPAVDSAVRAATISALQDAPRSPRLDQMLKGALFSPDETLAIPAAKFLRARGHEDMRLGSRVLASVHSSRARALVAPVCPTEPNDVHDLLGSEDHLAAAVALYDLPDEQLAAHVREIQELARAPHPLLRALALCRLPETEGDRDVISPRMLDPDPLVRLAAAAALMARGVTPEPDQTFRDLRSTIRAHGMTALRRLGTDLAAGGFPTDLRPAIVSEINIQVNSNLDQAGWENLRRRHAGARESVRRSFAREARMVITRDNVGEEQLLDAVSTLAWAGERADIATLLALANRMSALQKHCRESVEALLGRSNVGLGGGEGLDALAAWWKQRSYALEVPTLKTRALSTR